MEKTLQKTANLLILNIQNIESVGLLNGKMGIVVFLYHYSRYTSQPVYSDLADNLLDELFGSLKLNLPHTITNGITGIGFGLSHLIKNRFLETEESPDELFKDIDIRLSRDVNGQLRLDMRSEFPVFSSGFYVLSRIESGRRTSQKNKLISQLLMAINTNYTTCKHGISPVFTHSVIHFLNGIYNYGIYKTQVKKIMKIVLVYILNHASIIGYSSSDASILRYLLSSAQTNIELASKILAQVNQIRILPEDNANINVVERNLYQYALYPNFNNPDFLTLQAEKYVGDCIAESAQSGLSLLPYIGLHLMGVKLC